jgi:hypothetical protein
MRKLVESPFVSLDGIVTAEKLAPPAPTEA